MQSRQVVYLDGGETTVNHDDSCAHSVLDGVSWKIIRLAVMGMGTIFLDAHKVSAA